MTTFRIDITSNAWIDVDVLGKSGNVCSVGLKNTAVMDAADTEYNAAIDGIESLVLAMACEGIDVSTIAMRDAIRTAIDAIENNL